MFAAEPLGGAQAGGDIVDVETLLHARLVVGGGEHATEHFQHAFFDLGAGVVVAPGLAHECGRSVAIALREQSTRQHVTALAGRRLLPGEERAHGAIVDAIIPQRVLRATAEQWGMRPARVRLDEGCVALKGGVGVVGTQDHPFGEFARDRIGDARFGGIGVCFLAFAAGLDDPFHCSNIGVRGGGRRRDCEGA